MGYGSGSICGIKNSVRRTIEEPAARSILKVQVHGTKSWHIIVLGRQSDGGGLPSFKIAFSQRACVLCTADSLLRFAKFENAGLRPAHSKEPAAQPQKSQEHNPETRVNGLLF